MNGVTNGWDALMGIAILAFCGFIAWLFFRKLD